MRIFSLINDLSKNKNQKSDKTHAVIIGAMKSGTSSLFHYLGQHPNVCPSKPKEPQFFSDPNRRNQEILTYYNYWKSNYNHKVLLEASTNYSKFPLFSGIPKAIDNSKIIPKLIYIVRNPFDRIISHYNHSIQRGRKCEILDGHLLNVSNYYLQLEQYKEYFHRKDICLLDYDNLTLAPHKIIEKVFKFLNLDEHPIDFSKTHNKTSERMRMFLFFKRNGRSLKSTLTSEQHLTIYNGLKPSMDKLNLEYDVDVRKWGF